MPSKANEESSSVWIKANEVSCNFDIIGGKKKHKQKRSEAVFRVQDEQQQTRKCAFTQAFSPFFIFLDLPYIALPP